MEWLLISALLYIKPMEPNKGYITIPIRFDLRG